MPYDAYGNWFVPGQGFTNAQGQPVDDAGNPMAGSAPPPAQPGLGWWGAIKSYPQHLADGLMNMATLPGRVASGEVDPMSPGAMDWAAGTALSLPAPGMAAAEEGALGAAGGRVRSKPAASAAAPADDLASQMAALLGQMGPPPEAIDPATVQATREAGFAGVDARNRIAGLNPNNLPMHEASRMARAEAMGFDTSKPLYHGTPATFDQFRAEPAGTWLADDPAVASVYGGSPTSGQVLPVFARMGKTANLDMAGGMTGPEVDAQVEALRTAGGHNSATVQNIKDQTSGTAAGSVHNQYAVFDPSDIRSKFAVFDPSRAGEADLMAAGGVGAPPPAQQQQNGSPMDSNSDPWASFPVVQGAPAPSSPAPAPDPWSAFPVVTAAPAASTPATDDDPSAYLFGGAPADNTGTAADRRADMATRATGALDAAVGGMGSGIPFADRAAAALRTGAGDVGLGGLVADKGSYSGNLAQIRSEQADRAQQYPGTFEAAGFAGGATLPLGAVGDVARGATLAARLGRGAAAGGVIGGAQGLSSTPDLGQPVQAAKDAAEGAGFGAGLGAALPVAGQAGGWALRKVLGPGDGTISGLGKSASSEILKQ